LRTRALTPLLFLSGAAALVLEVSWFRRVAQVAGGTSVAMAAVLAAVIGGMALGAFWLGRRADRVESPLRLYGYLELGVTAFAVATPWLLDLSEGLFTTLQALFGGSPALLAATQFLTSTLLLTAPAILLGGTLPAAAAALRAAAPDRGRAIGWLYAWNTLGAVAGTLAAGFLLLPSLGLSDTMRSAAVLSGAAGALALFALRPAPARAPLPQRPAPGDAGRTRRALVLYAASGFLGLACEVAFTRSLVLVFGSSTYAFSTMLAVFLLGIGVGGAIGTRLAGHRPIERLETTVAATAALFGLCAVAVFLLPRALLEGQLAFGAEFGTGLVLRVLLSAAALLPGTIGLGLAFPLAAQVAAERATGAGTGRLYAANTLASVVGSTLTVFVLLPHLGPQYAVVSVALLAGLVAALSARRLLPAALLLLAAVGLLPPPAPARERLLSGIYFNWHNYVVDDRIDERVWSEGVDVPFVAHGREATVAVLRWYGTFGMLVNGKAVATNQIFSDVHHLTLLGHLPMAVHPEARRVLVVGLGMGLSYRAAAWHGPERLTVVEIEPAVIEAAAYLGLCPEEVVVADARSYLKATEERFDVITTDPIHPWVRGAGDLYSREFLLACRDRLAPGGVVCHWLPNFQLGKEDMRRIVRTFTTVFRTEAYYAGGDLVLLGADGHDPGRPRPVELPAGSVLESDLGLLRVAGHERLLAATLDAEVLTDDALRLEFSTPRHRRSPELEACMRWIRELWDEPPAPYAAVLAAEEAWARFDGARMRLMLDRARKEAPGHPLVRRLTGEMALLLADDTLRSGETDLAAKDLARARLYLPGDPRLVGLEGDLRAAEGRREEAVALFRELLEAHGDSAFLERKIAALEVR
jgi:spermidine synthase